MIVETLLTTMIGIQAPAIYVNDAVKQDSIIEIEKMDSYDIARFLDEKKYLLKEVPESTFAKHLIGNVSYNLIENQDKFAEIIAEEINSSLYLHRINVDADSCSKAIRDELENLIFDKVIKNKLKIEIRNPYDLLVGIEMAVEYLSEYNDLMILETCGIGWDINNDGRFDGIDENEFNSVKIGKKLRRFIRNNPDEGLRYIRKITWLIDKTPAGDLLLMGEGKKNRIKWICRNYTEAMYTLFDLAKHKYPELTKDIEFLPFVETDFSEGEEQVRRK